MRPLLLAALFTTCTIAAEPEPWGTYRANAARTGNGDRLPGPKKPKLLWALPSQEHFIAAPVPVGDVVLFSALGTFNRPALYAFPIAATGKPEPRWQKGAPFLTLPTVSSPARFGKSILFGDGMHQTDGAVFYCIPSDGGYPLWQLKVPGILVHMEGAPTVLGKRAYIGTGSAGVLCVQADRASVNGKDFDLETLADMQRATWKSLEAEYAEDKKKDPDFAMPPTEEKLLKPTPKLLWQAGKEKWHVDAAVNVVDDAVYVASAFLDKELKGDRKLFRLKADDGSVVWSAPLRLNSWGGPTVSGNTVIVTGSSISYDPKALTEAKGEVVAFDTVTGTEKWRKELTGGVLACAVVVGETVVFGCTDGKVRAHKLADGERLWTADVGAPIFGPIAVAGDVYAGDIQGGVYAFDLATGKRQWKLDLDPGAIYGGVTVEGGKLFVATCNLEGPNVRKPTVVACIGDVP